MHRFLTRHSWIWLPLALALVLAGVLRGAVHLAAPGSPWAEICSAGGASPLPVSGNPAPDAVNAAPCLLCLLAVQGWSMAGISPAGQAAPAPEHVRVVEFGTHPSGIAWAVAHAPPRGPPAAG